MNFESVLRTAAGDVDGSIDYEPVQDPFNPKSEPVKVQLTRLTGMLAITLSALNTKSDFVCVEILRPSQPNGVMSSAVSFPNHTLLDRLSPLSG